MSKPGEWIRADLDALGYGGIPGSLLEEQAMLDSLRAMQNMASVPPPPSQYVYQQVLGQLGNAKPSQPGTTKAVTPYYVVETPWYIATPKWIAQVAYRVAKFWGAVFGFYCEYETRQHWYIFRHRTKVRKYTPIPYDNDPKRSDHAEFWCSACYVADRLKATL